MKLACSWLSHVRRSGSVNEHASFIRTSIDIHCLLYSVRGWERSELGHVMAAQGAFGTNFYDRSILHPKHRAYYRSGRPVVKIGPKGALGSHEIRPIHSAPSLGQSIHLS